MWWRGGGGGRRGVAHGLRVGGDCPSVGAQLALVFAPKRTTDKQEKHRAPHGLIPNWPLTWQEKNAVRRACDQMN